MSIIWYAKTKSGAFQIPEYQYCITSVVWLRKLVSAGLNNSIAAAKTPKLNITARVKGDGSKVRNAFSKLWAKDIF